MAKKKPKSSSGQSLPPIMRKRSVMKHRNDRRRGQRDRKFDRDAESG